MADVEAFPFARGRVGRWAARRTFRLVEMEAWGERKGRAYHLSAATYRRMGEESAYVRRRGFEPLQQEQRVLQYVQTYGQVTRREVAELCRIGEFQAGRLLKGLVESGKLRLKGAGRGAYYELNQ